MIRPVTVGGRRGWQPPTATRRAERGAATAEAAAVLPVFVAIAMGLVWLIAVASAQVRIVDGAREAARAAARGQSVSVAERSGSSVAPDGARFAISLSDETVRVVAVAPVRGPGGLFGFLPQVEVRSTAVAQVEPR